LQEYNLAQESLSDGRCVLACVGSFLNVPCHHLCCPVDAQPMLMETKFAKFVCVCICAHVSCFMHGDFRRQSSRPHMTRLSLRCFLCVYRVYVVTFMHMHRHAFMHTCQLSPV
jgi:hypothetical protein